MALSDLIFIILVDTLLQYNFSKTFSFLFLLYWNKKKVYFASSLVLLQGHISLDSLPKRGYHVPKKGTVQVVSTVVYLFDLSAAWREALD